MITIARDSSMVPKTLLRENLSARESMEAARMGDQALLTGVFDAPVTLQYGNKEGDYHHGRGTSLSSGCLVGLGRTGLAKSSSAPMRSISLRRLLLGAGRQVDTGRFTPLCGRQLLYDYLSLARRILQVRIYDLEVEVDGGISKAETGYSFGEVFIKANLTIPQEEERARALKLLHKAKSLCLVSRALSSNSALNRTYRWVNRGWKSARLCPLPKRGEG